MLLELKLKNIRKNNNIYELQVENNEQKNETINIEPNYEVERILNSKKKPDDQLLY